jgi:translation initiation factor IF-1
MPSPWAQRLVGSRVEPADQTTDRHGLWAVLTNLDWHGNETRVMARLGIYSTFDAALADHQIADARVRGQHARRSIRIHQSDVGLARVAPASQRLEYLAVRSEDDLGWAQRYPNVNPGRWTALLTREGSTVRVHIYGNTYTGTVTRSRRLSAEVTFATVGDQRAREKRANTFPILPPSRFDRGIQSVIR